jgi:hypothetical protein
MNEYCFNLNLDIPPLRKDLSLDDLPKARWNLLGVDVINPDLISFLKTKEINISVISSFYDAGATFDQKIHTDLPTICDMTKLIWGWGDYHILNWYMPVDPINSNISNKSTNLDNSNNLTNPNNGIRNYAAYDRESLTVVHTSKIGFPSLIQVGIPHQGINFAGARRSLTIILHDTTGNVIPMQTAKSIFEPYIKVH